MGKQMRKLLLLPTKLMIFTLLCLQFQSAQAVPDITLEDWIFKFDADFSDNSFGDQLPTTGTLVDGLGTLSLDITDEGSHNVIGYFDFEIAESINTFFNEFGFETGTPGIGQSWEIDEQGFHFDSFGDIVFNALDGLLDNSNGVPSGFEKDVAFALGWDFSLLTGDIATIDYVFTDLLPTVDFFLTQTDPNLGESLYFYSSLNIQTSGGPPGPAPDPVDVPEPPVLYLMLTALSGLFLRNRLINRRKIANFPQV